MANIKSAKKRILVINKKTERNKAIRSRVKTYIKRVYAAIDENNKEAANTALNDAIAEMSKAGSKGVYHKSTVSRKISRMTKAVNAIQ
ncbi:MAG: 30S ribosomal protein S20 [Lachnospiraceae bacterium]|nr:30S ribosomal protein S20 [Lachnospiraceae bacterium]